MRPARFESNKVFAGGPLRLVIGAALTATFYEWAVFATTFVRPGLIGINYHGVGSDWMVFHAAARAYLGGHLAMIYDGRWLTAFLNQSYRAWLSASLPFRPWVYPPSFLLLIAPFGRLGFLGSFVVFQVLSSAALVAAVVVGAGPDKARARFIACCAVLCPAAAVNAVCGQNAVLVAALLVGGLRLLGPRPLLGGAVLGLLTFKPQFAVLAPVAIVACGQWKSLAAFMASGAALATASLWVFGAGAWIAWTHLTLQSMAAPSSDWVEFGRMWGSSVWTCAMLLGAGSKLASALQLAAALFAVAAVWLAFARPFGLGERLAVLLTAACLAAPHWSPYDAVLLALAALFWVLRGPPAAVPSWRWTVFLLMWLLPLLSPPALVAPARLTPLLLIGFIAAVIWCGRGRVVAPSAAHAGHAGHGRPALGADL